MKDNIRMKQQDKDTLAMSMKANDLSGVHMTGQITDRIYKNGVFVEERVGHNLVVNSFLDLVMTLLKNQNGFKGIQYWAIGSGAEAWDDSLPTPDISATKLTNEIGRVAITADNITFLDSSYNPTSSTTNVLQISHTFGENDCNGVWREFGLFGGNATSTANSGVMINKRHHQVISKTPDMTVERVMRFTLSLT